MNHYCFSGTTDIYKFFKHLSSQKSYKNKCQLSDLLAKYTCIRTYINTCIYIDMQPHAFFFSNVRKTYLSLSSNAKDNVANTYHPIEKDGK